MQRQLSRLATEKATAAAAQGAVEAAHSEEISDAAPAAGATATGAGNGGGGDSDSVESSSDESSADELDASDLTRTSASSKALSAAATAAAAVTAAANARDGDGGTAASNAALARNLKQVLVHFQSNNTTASAKLGRKGGGGGGAAPAAPAAPAATAAPAAPAAPAQPAQQASAASAAPAPATTVTVAVEQRHDGEAAEEAAQRPWYAVYRAILPGMGQGDVVAEVAALPQQRRWAYFMLRGGHFAGAIFQGDKVTVHKCFHKYVLRSIQLDGIVMSHSDAHSNTS